MKTLFLVRHAKSSHDNPALSDRERPLNDRGRQEALLMGQWLAKRHVKPDLIISSPAVRALAAAQAIARKLDYDFRHIAIDERLYAGTADVVLSVVRSLNKKVDSVMLFGHNPEISKFAGRLLGETCDLPTCALAEFRYETKAWCDVGGSIAPSKVTLDAP